MTNDDLQAALAVLGTSAKKYNQRFALALRGADTEEALAAAEAKVDYVVAGASDALHRAALEILAEHSLAGAYAARNRIVSRRERAQRRAENI